MADDERTLQQAQKAVDDWINQWEEGYWPPLSNLARLSEEVGELARLLNELHGAKPPKDSSPASGDDVAEELGDILFVTIGLANSLDVDLDDALRQVMEKYGVRDAHRFTPAEERDDH